MYDGLSKVLEGKPIIPSSTALSPVATIPNPTPAPTAVTTGAVQTVSNPITSATESNGKSKEKFTCNECGKSFHRRANLYQHSRIHDKSRHLTCGLCGKVFKFPGDLKKHHARVHIAIPKEQCPLCPQKFIYKYTVETHLHRDHGQAKQKCRICGREFTHLNNLSVHMKKQHPVEGQALQQPAENSKETPERETNFGCEVCGKVFNSKPKLHQHSRIHDESRHVKCEQCDKVFHFPGDLKKHYIRMHGATPNQLCPLCPQKFMSQYTLETHLYRAHGHKGHTCYLCGCQYAHLVDLNRHIKIHAEHLTPKVEKPLGVAVNGSHNDVVDQNKSTEEIEEQVVKEEYDEMDTTPQTSSPLLSKDGNTFKCPKCPFENATLNDLLEHLKFAHTNLLNNSIPGNAPNSAQNDKQDSKEENQNDEQEEEDSDVEIIPNKTQPGSSVIMNKAPPPLIPAPHIIHGHHNATQNHFAQKGLYQCPECLCHKESPEDLFTHLTLHHNFNRFTPGGNQPSLNLPAGNVMPHSMNSIFDGGINNSDVGIIQEMDQMNPLIRTPVSAQPSFQTQPVIPLNMNLSNPMMMTHQIGTGSQFGQVGNNSLHQNQNSL